MPFRSRKMTRPKGLGTAMDREGAGRGRPIIIVEDDKETRVLLTMVLEREGYEVRTAANGLRLISMLQADNPSLILLDVMLSWIDGFELCRALKKNDEFKNIPVVFVSAKKSEKDIKKGHDCGCAGYFTKPIDMDALLARVAVITGRVRE